MTKATTIGLDIAKQVFQVHTRRVVYYSSAGFFLLQACHPEHVPVWRCSLFSAEDSCGFGASRFINMALTSLESELEAIGRLW